MTGRSRVFNNSFAATIKYNSINGDSIWVKRDTGIYRNGSSADIAIDEFGSIYITGGTNNIPPGSAIDILTIKYTTQGDKEWSITYNGPFNGGDGGYALKLDTSNNFYVMGVSQSSSQIFDYIVMKYSQLVGIQTNGNKIPASYVLSQNYPNPFNPSTIIRFSIPRNSFIQIKIYDVLGRIKEIPVNEKLHPSEYKLSFVGSNYSSGVYFYQLIADGILIDTKKLVLIK